MLSIAISCVGRRLVLGGIFGASQYALDSTGSLVYLPADSGQSNRTMVWVDRRGAETPIAAEAAPYGNFALSPDGTRVALRLINDATLWVYDLVRNVRTRLTFETDKVMTPNGPTWSPDGLRVAFGTPLTWKRADGVGGSERLDADPRRSPHAFTPDGAALIFGSSSGNLGLLGVLTLAGTRTVHQPLLGESARQGNAALSRDGRWLAYASNDGGSADIYVRPFPDVNAGKWQVSTSGNVFNAAWSPVGNELFFRAPTGMMVMTFTTEPTFTPGTVTQLFPWPAGVAGIGVGFGVSPDGKRFLLLKDSTASGNAAAQTSRIMFVQNWTEELTRLVPPK